MPRFSGREQGSGGWSALTPSGHLCFPPLVYPQGAGPGSQWICPNCSTTWHANGMRVIGDYPVNISRGDAAIGPLSWSVLSGRNPSGEEMDMYDFDPVLIVRQQA